MIAGEEVARDQVARLPRAGQVWRANRVLSAATSAQAKELRANRLGQLAEASSDKRKTSETVSDVSNLRMPVT